VQRGDLVRVPVRDRLLDKHDDVVHGRHLPPFRQWTSS
jgi:hypothetical protein